MPPCLPCPGSKADQRSDQDGQDDCRGDELIDHAAAGAALLEHDVVPQLLQNLLAALDTLVYFPVQTVVTAESHLAGGRCQGLEVGFVRVEGGQDLPLGVMVDISTGQILAHDAHLAIEFLQIADLFAQHEVFLVAAQHQHVFEQPVLSEHLQDSFRAMDGFAHAAVITVLMVKTYLLLQFHQLLETAPIVGKAFGQQADLGIVQAPVPQADGQALDIGLGQFEIVAESVLLTPVLVDEEVLFVATQVEQVRLNITGEHFDLTDRAVIADGLILQSRHHRNRGKSRHREEGQEEGSFSA